MSFRLSPVAESAAFVLEVNLALVGHHRAVLRHHRRLRELHFE